MKEAWPRACAAHLRPVPLAEEGVALGRFALHHDAGDRIGLMDVSDGLARDLPRLLASRQDGLGADIALTDDMLPEEVRRYAAGAGISAADFAFEGGEDYALVGTSPEVLWPELADGLAERGGRVTALGTVRAGGITLNGRKPACAGFDHFSR